MTAHRCSIIVVTVYLEVDGLIRLCKKLENNKEGEKRRKKRKGREVELKKRRKGDGNQQLRRGNG